ncbi:oxidoreductase, aldo/keto reductase family [Verrucomicrobiia bacterium DG1235]|nr:oxidoreductase, aldo/keto reductase family [Verrucomicrobiae bacterium DG1235]
MYFGADAVGWGPTDDDESIRALHAAFEDGIQFFDTADMYGGGHSEKLVGEAFADRRDEVVIATKFGNRFESETRKMLPEPGVSPDYIRSACEASLKRLGTDHIDLYQFHVNDHPADQIDDIIETLDGLVEAGKIKAYGWSTDFPDRATAFLKARSCASFQYQFNVFDPNPAMVEICEKNGMIGINRGPLAMGLLTGKYKPNTALHKDDVRGQNAPTWLQYFRDGAPNSEFLKRLESIREILTSGGRTLTQGALAWNWGKSCVNLPIPGVRTVAQAKENAGALSFGPLSADQVAEVDRLLDR